MSEETTAVGLDERKQVRLWMGELAEATDQEVVASAKVFALKVLSLPGGHSADLVASEAVVVGSGLHLSEPPKKVE